VKQALTAASTTAPAAVTPDDAKFVIAYKQDVIQKKLKPFLEFTKGFAGPNVIEMVRLNILSTAVVVTGFPFSQAGLIEKEYYILLDFLKLVGACQKPQQDTLEILMQDFPKAIESVNRAKEQMRRDREWFAHLTLLCEIAPVIAWVVNVRAVEQARNILNCATFCSLNPFHTSQKPF
jgi:adenylyl cyclase-associated protein